MNADEAKRAIKQLAGLFPGNVTEQLASLMRADFKAFDFKTTFQAIGDHKRAAADGVLNYQRFLNDLALAHKPASTTSNAVIDSGFDREGTWCDIQRRMNPQLAGRSDHEVILRVYRGWWKKCPQTDLWHAKLTRECKALLERHEMAADISGGWTDTIFAQHDEHFRSALHQLRGDIPFAESEPETVGATA